jgi:hypothetical protein
LNGAALSERSGLPTVNIENCSLAMVGLVGRFVFGNCDCPILVRLHEFSRAMPVHKCSLLAGFSRSFVLRGVHSIEISKLVTYVGLWTATTELRFSCWLLLRDLKSSELNYEWWAGLMGCLPHRFRPFVRSSCLSATGASIMPVTTKMKAKENAIGLRSYPYGPDEVGLEC